MICPLQEVCEEIQKHQGHPRKQQEQDQQETGHPINVLSRWTRSHGLCFAISPKTARLEITMQPTQPKWIWEPSPEWIERTNVYRFMQRLGIPDREQFIRFSQERLEEFWAEMVKEA